MPSGGYDYIRTGGDAVYYQSKKEKEAVELISLINTDQDLSNLFIYGIEGEDIKRTFMYHGSEHKCINCIEHGLELNVANVRASSKEHKRCGTSFIMIVMVISILFFVVIRTDTIWLRIVSRIVLIPVIAGVSYEFLSFAGKHDSKLVDILSRPGMWMQGLTTKEPDDTMIEVAIAAVEAVFDWRAYLDENFPGWEKKEEQA